MNKSLIPFYKVMASYLRSSLGDFGGIIGVLNDCYSYMGDLWFVYYLNVYVFGDDLKRI